MKSENELEREAEKRCAVFLKENFLQRAGAYFVFTSHIQSVRHDLILYIEGFNASDRRVKLVSLPVVDGLKDLQQMDQTSSAGLTYMEASYFSQVPSLLWTSQFGDHSLGEKFQRVSKGYGDYLEPFLAEVLTGTPKEGMEPFHCLTDGSRKEDGRILWILGYISHFLHHCDHPYSWSCRLTRSMRRWASLRCAARRTKSPNS